MVKPFEFKQCINILKSTGEKAISLRELRKQIASVSDVTIFHHTYQYFMKGHILEYTNDFAQWIGENLEEAALSEQIANIDPYEYSQISELREKLLNVIDEYFDNFPEPRDTLPGSEFYFVETITLIFPSGVKAKNLAEFLIAIRYIDAASIYYHFYEARIRLGSGADDFSKWIKDTLGKNELAENIMGIDPFMHNIEGIREHLEEIIEEEVKKEMESMEI
ncbi:hypothetical protein BMS3Abin07_02307 [bacterium BMS3Abin07]|nr:hypothetical protein BMS3Abin07_02307 [bacterium BMS3Abin07]GBE31908.1 hypothetical protein BMS3Bbin05_00812 [bacterium BMS3Bbin05]HDO22612.1 hypothetical protein [Nitrospirota bacterium]